MLSQEPLNALELGTHPSEITVAEMAESGGRQHNPHD